jgi:hypothetical protein
MDAWQAATALGMHRHPDYWGADSHARQEQLEEARTQRPGAPQSRTVRSARDRPQPVQRTATDRALIDARRRHAAGEGPAPEHGGRDGAAAVMGYLQRR